jgi:hypothetical protein
MDQFVVPAASAFQVAEPGKEMRERSSNAGVDDMEDTPMKHGQIDYKVGWIAAGVAALGMAFLAADITIKHSSSPVSSRATGSNTVASAQSAGAQVTQSDRKVEKEHPPETQ